jgi:hypothetical protein
MLLVLGIRAGALVLTISPRILPPQIERHEDAQARRHGDHADQNAVALSVVRAVLA